jgi:hypothetical protein
VLAVRVPGSFLEKAKEIEACVDVRRVEAVRSVDGAAKSRSESRTSRRWSSNAPTTRLENATIRPRLRGFRLEGDADAAV